MLAERRLAHFVELYHSGRWKRYYGEAEFLLKMREAMKARDRWAEIAPALPQVAPSSAGPTESVLTAAA
jgi:uncharacterized repeat protein (TIGR03809 family)